jgi:hypothetical protein
MKLHIIAALACLTISSMVMAAAPAPAAAGPAAKARKLYAITSWGDIVAIYGPGTDPAMDTPQALENMINHWKARGYTGVYMRTDLGQIDPLIRRNPITATSQASEGTGNSDPRLAWLYKYIDRVQSDFDYHELGASLSKKHGFEWWAWHPHLYSDGAPETAGAPGPGRIWPWTYCDKYKFEHPEIVTIDRKGNQYWMVREYAYPGARESKVAEFVHMAKTFGIKRFIACMRSEATQIQEAPDKADRYGFNKPVVEDMKRLYGVDIMTDPRFDVDSASFDPKDPMVGRWHDLRGSYVTQFYRGLRKALRQVDPEIQLAVTLSGEHVGPPLGNWRLDWRTWVNEGLVDAIITPVFFEASLDNDAGKKGYLTFGREDIGVVSCQALREHIAKSPHPEIQVIATNAPPYIFSAPPEGADGWRIDAWYSTYHLAWYQRWWTQCVKDVETLGHIQFIRQNFDDFPVGSAGHAGGWGDARYNPAIRACPGVWFKLGDGSDAGPHATKKIAHGDSGQSIKLTAVEGSRGALTAMHTSFPDRSGIYAGVDNAITNGKTVFEFWVYRDSAESALSAFLQETDGERDVGLRIAPDSGKVSYSVAKQGSEPAWTEADFTVPVRQWQRLMIEVNLDRRVYSGYASEGQSARPLWRDVAIEQPKPRRVIQHFNVMQPIEVPTYKMFRQVQFIPEGKAGGVSYLDDVAVNWTPTLHYTRPRPKALFHDDFERHAVDGPVNNARTKRAGMWSSTSDAGTAAFTVTNDTSFGEGVNALRATAGGTVVAKGEPLRHIPNSYITVDLDVYVRSDKDYPYVMPDLKATSNHTTMTGLRRKGSADYAAVALASRGTWWLWDGARFRDSGVRVAYDVWNHLQVAIDAPTGTYRVVAQPVGEMPTLVGTAHLGEAIVINSDLEFFIETSETENHLSLYDNVLVTAGSRP